MSEEEKNEALQGASEASSNDTVELVGDSEEKAKAEKKVQRDSKTFSRRSLIGGVAAGVVGGALVGAGVTHFVDDQTFNDASPSGAAYTRIELNNEQQYYDLDYPSGIIDAAQRYTVFAMFNMNDHTDKTDLQLLLARWTATCATLQAGKTTGEIRPTFSESSVPKDMGETADLDPCSLTITIGFGPSLFDDRFGIESFKPEHEYFKEWDRITGEKLITHDTGSDFGIQICADDRQVIFHAVRTLAKIARGTATLDYMQEGFLPIRQSDDQPTPRDLFGFRDGTTNPTEEQEFEDFVWVKDTKQEWLLNGSFLCYGRTIIDIETWENDRISDQEQLVGRRKDTGAPLSNPDGDEFDIPDLTAKDEDGNYLIDPNSHVAITSDQRLGFKVLRRGYNYWSGLNDHGDQNAGFVQVTYVNDPYNYWLLRDDMGKYDRLNEYYYDDFRGVYAVPHAPATGTYLGQEFFE